MEPIAIDLETSGLDPVHDTVELITVKYPNKEPIAVRPLFAQPLLDDLAQRDLVLHNAAFDLAFLREHYNFVPRGRVYDTYVLSQLAHAGEFDVRSHSLAACAQRELGIELDKTEQLSDWSGELTEAQIAYAFADVEHLENLRTTLLGKMRSEKQIVDLELDLLPVMADMFRHGVFVDREAWTRRVEWAQAWQNHFEQLLDTFGNSAAAKLDPEYGVGLGDWTYDHDYNWGSPADVMDVAHLHGIELWDTRDETLAGHDHPFTNALRKYRKYSKLTTTYGLDWLRKNVGEDGVVRSNWKQAGTDTGRFSSSSPNLQNIPREGGFREAFRARPGYKFVIADYSQLELRVGAVVAGERRMIDAYMRGEDLHKLTASLVLDKPLAEVTKHDRQVAKSLNFGLLFGMGHKNLRTYARTSYGVELTVKQAQKLRSDWLAAYPAVKQWHQRVGKALERKPRPVIKTKYGRVRGGEPRFTEAVNMPVQGLAADGLKAAMIEIHKAMPDARIVMVVHDEVVAEVPEDKADDYLHKIKMYMQVEMQDMLNAETNYDVPVEVEADISDEWVK